MFEFFAGLRETLQVFLQDHQYKAMALLIGVEEAGVPLPLPGDLAIAFMGYQVSLGRANPVIVVVSTIGSASAGASVLYWISRSLSRRILAKFGRFLHLNEARLDRVERWFTRYGAPVIIFGRLIPGLRIGVAVAAGILRVTYWKFLVYTAISAAIWAAIYMGIGWGLGRHYQRVEEVVEKIGGDPLLVLAIVVAVGLLAALVFYIRRKRRAVSSVTDVEA